MTTIKEKIDIRLNDTFGENLHKYLIGEFPGATFTRSMSFESMRLVTTWDAVDTKTCAEIKIAIKAYESAYSTARFEVRNA